ncbi:MAG: hypothetical protein ABSE95_04145, partial [Thermodesulfobacteriota bacterium]
MFKKVLSASLEVFIEVGIRLLTGSLFKSSTIGSQPGTFLKLDKVERTERPDRLQGNAVDGSASEWKPLKELGKAER